MSLILVATTVPVTAWGMTKARYAPQEFALAAVLAPRPDDVSQRRATERRIARSFSTDRAIADYLDSLDLPDGSVLTDTVYGFAVIAATRRPKVFVVPSDFHFVARLGDPAAKGVRYLLAVPNTGRGQADALNLRYPTLFETGADVASLDLEIPNDGADLPTWRLYRVVR